MGRLPVLETERLILRPAAPDLAKYTLAFYRKNAAALQPVEPTFPEDFLTPGFQRSMLRQADRELFGGSVSCQQDCGSGCKEPECGGCDRRAEAFRRELPGARQAGD